MIGQHPHYLLEHWLHAKLLLVLVLIVLDLRVYFRAAAFLAGRVELHRRECMALHGAISLVFFGILILVLLKPFGAGGAPRAPRCIEFWSPGESTPLDAVGATPVVARIVSQFGVVAASLPRHVAA